MSGANGSALNIVGDLTVAGTIDLTQISGAGITFKDSAADIANSIQLADDGVLKLASSLADGLTVTNASGGTNTGKVVLNGSLAANRATSLAKPPRRRRFPPLRQC